MSEVTSEEPRFSGDFAENSEFGETGDSDDDFNPAAPVLAFEKRVPQQRPVKILCHARVFSLARVDALHSTFECRFDLYLAWPEQVEGSLDRAARAATARGGRAGPTNLLWEPSLRFPNAVTHRCVDEKLYFVDHERRRIGYRMTVEGSFKCVQNLKAFPFDRQGLQVVLQLGFEEYSKGQLYADDYQLIQNPEQPNLMFSQHDPEFSFRALRVQATATGPLEAAAPISKLILIVPADRKSGRYLTTTVFAACLLSTLGVFAFALPTDPSSQGARMGVPTLLVTALFQTRTAFPGAALPATGALTWLEWYLIYCFSNLVAVFVLAGTATESAGNITGAVVCVVYWSSCNIYAYYTAQAHIESGPEYMGRFGKMDPMSQRLLAENGVRVTTFGTLADINKYQNLMNVGSTFETTLG